MFCPNCGTEQQDDAVFCTECGQRLEAPAAEGDASASDTTAVIAHTAIVPDAVAAEETQAFVQPYAQPSYTQPSYTQPSIPAGQTQGASDKPLLSKLDALPKWAPFAALAAVLVGVAVGVLVWMNANSVSSESSVASAVSASSSQDLGGISAVSSASTSATSSTPAASSAPAAPSSYTVSFSGDYVAIYSDENPNTPYQITNLAVADLDAKTAASVGAGLHASSFDEAQSLVENLRADVQKAAEEAAAKKAKEEEAAAKKAKEEEAAAKKAQEEKEAAAKKAAEEAAAAKRAEEEAARKKAEEEEAARKKAEEEEAARKRAEEEEAARKAAAAAPDPGRVVDGMSGWWQMVGTESYVYISDGSWIIYRADGSEANHFRSLSAGDLQRRDNGMPSGPFAGVPGYYIPTTDPASLGYFIPDSDFKDNDRIDVIQHADPEGGSHDDGQNIYRVSPPSWA